MTAKYHYDDIVEMLPAFALGALQADEMLAVEEYLRTAATPELLAQLEQFEDAAALMALEAPAQPLPPHLKGQIFSAIHAEAASKVLPPISARTQTKAPRAPVPIKGEASEGSFGRWLGGLLRPLAWAAVGAALAFALLQPLNQTTQSDLIATRAELQELRGENLALQQINQSLQSQMNVSDQQLAVLARGSQAISLAQPDGTPGASGALYVGQGEGVLVLSGLDVLPENQTYQMWMIPEDGAPVPSALLAVRQSDVSSLTLTLEDDAANYAAIGVTVEPAGGSPAPTGPVVLVGQISS